jgi:alanyl-tRNA synthetase
LLKQSADVLSVPFQELPKSTEKFFGQWKEQRKQIDALKSARVAALRAKLIKKIKANQARALIEGLDAAAMAALAQRILKEKPAAVVVLANKRGNLLVMAGPKSKHKALDVFKKIAKKSKARGGGNDRIAQGFAQDINALRKLFK